MDSNLWYRGIKAVDFRGIPGIAGIGRALISIAEGPKVRLTLRWGVDSNFRFRRCALIANGAAWSRRLICW